MSARRRYTRGIFAAGVTNGKFSALAIFWILNRAKILNAQNILNYDTDKKMAQAGGADTRRYRVHVRTMRARRVQHGKQRLQRRAVPDLLRTRIARLFQTRAAIRHVQRLQRVRTLPTRTKERRRMILYFLMCLYMRVQSKKARKDFESLKNWHAE